MKIFTLLRNGILLIGVLCLIFHNQAQAATITSNVVTGGLWSAPSTWILGVVPTSTDDVIIKNASIVINGSFVVKSLYLNKDQSGVDALSLSGTNTLSNTAGGLPNLTIIILGLNDSGTINYASKNTHGFDAIFNSGLTDIQAIQQSHIVTLAQSILNRA